MADETASKQYDLYASLLNYKKDVEPLLLPFRSSSWVPLLSQRRLQAYEVLAAFYGNYSRDYRLSPEGGNTSLNDTLMEMGEAKWLCDKIKAKLLGDKMRLAIPVPQRLKADAGAIKVIAEREAFLHDWWDENNVAAEIDTNETTCSYLGDCCYMVDWDAVNATARIRGYDPGFVFPQFGIDEASYDEAVQARVKDRVTLAWEIYDYDDKLTIAEAQQAFKLFRDVYELRAEGDVRTLWHRACQYRYQASDDITVDTLDDLPDSSVIEGTDTGWVKLGIDFMPFVWVPNIAVLGETFGISNLASHIQNIDALINGTSDLSRNSEYLGGAVIFASGKDISLPRDQATGAFTPIGIKPCTIYPLGENGKMDVLDTAGMQQALLATIKEHRDTLIRNSCITEIGAGVQSSQAVPSGVALGMMLQPLVDKIAPMRSKRTVVYTNLFWMVQRLFASFGSPEERKLFSGDLYNVNLLFGPLVPVDSVAKLAEYNSLVPLIGLKEVHRRMKADGFDFDLAQVEADLAEESTSKAAQQAAAFGIGAAADQGGNQGQQGNQGQGGQGDGSQGQQGQGGSQGGGSAQ
jgi:hypothetical protein